MICGRLTLVCVQDGEVYNAGLCSRWTRLRHRSCCRICWCTPLATICSTRGVSCYVYDTCPRRMRGCIHAHLERTCMPVACVKPRQCRHIASARVWHASDRLPFYQCTTSYLPQLLSRSLLVADYLVRLYLSRNGNSGAASTGTHRRRSPCTRDARATAGPPTHASLPIGETVLYLPRRGAI